MLNSIGGISLNRQPSTAGYFANLKTPHLLPDLLPLFAELGIFPVVNVTPDGTQKLKITGIELDALHAAAILPMEKHRLARQVLESRGVKRPGRTLADYQMAMDMLEQGYATYLVKRRTGVTDPSIRDWKKGLVPQQVKRYAQAYQSAQRLGLPFEVRYPRALEAGLKLLER